MASRLAAVLGLLAGATAGAAQLPTISDVPRYEIGASEFDATDQLGRVVDLVLLPGGGVAILDALPAAVRIYGAQGEFIRDVGGPGEGPGEFRDPVDLALVDGDLVVLDADGRTSRFALDGTLLATDRATPSGLTSESFNPRPARVLPDGRVLFEARERMFGIPAGEYRQRVALVARRDGGVESFGTFAADTGRAEGSPVIPRPYIPADRFLFDAGPLGLAVLDGRGRLQVRAGSTTAATALPAAPQVLATDADVAEARDAMLGPITGANDRRVVGEWLDGMPRAERAPIARSLLLDDRGRSWIEWWPRSDGRPCWGVFDRQARALGEVRAPAGLRLVDLTTGRVAGVWRDAFGVERVRVHDLRDSGNADDER